MTSKPSASTSTVRVLECADAEPVLQVAKWYGAVGAPKFVRDENGNKCMVLAFRRDEDARRFRAFFTSVKTRGMAAPVAPGDGCSR